jgi:DUF4097 and DUF4098 domain-containing protein YvlB
MKFSLVPAVLGIIISLAGSTQSQPKADKNDAKSSEKVERSTAVDPHASITLCVMSGKLVVRGWDKSEVHARSTDAEKLEFRRVDKTKDPSSVPTRIDVMVGDKESSRGDCQAVADVEMDVPKDATVQLQTRDGDIYIYGVGGAFAGSQNGDITIERASKFVEAGSVGGSILLKDSSGRVNLSSAGGGVEAYNVKPVSSDDLFEVGTVSGDIQLERVSNAKLSAKTVSGTVTMTGPLAKAGDYGFTTMGGDVVLMLPHDASFKLNARVSAKSDIVSDFPLKYLAEPPTPPAPKPEPAPEAKHKAPKEESKGPKAEMKGDKGLKTGPIIAPIIVPRVVVANLFKRITAICGSGDATITLSSFGGTLHLQKM